MVSINVDNRIRGYIHEVCIGNNETTVPRIAGFLDAMIELAFINRAEYDGYIEYTRNYLERL